MSVLFNPLKLNHKYHFQDVLWLLLQVSFLNKKNLLNIKNKNKNNKN